MAELFGQPAFPGFLGARILFDSAGRSEGKAVCTYDTEEAALAATAFFHGRSFEYGSSFRIISMGPLF